MKENIDYKELKSEIRKMYESDLNKAINEFAEKIRDEIDTDKIIEDYMVSKKEIYNIIDKILKEMKE